MRVGPRVWIWSAALVLLAAAPAAGETQLRPFLGFTFGGGTTIIEPDLVSGHPKIAFGVSAVALGEVVGVEGDFGYGPGFFTGGHLVVASGVTTLTGNVVVALPKRLARYTLRPYVVAGGGLMHTEIDYALDALTAVGSTLAVIDFGGGATGFFTERIGVNWDVRHFGSIGGKDQTISLGTEQLSFWRASTAVVIRF